MNEPNLPPLHDNARAAVVRITRLLSEGFTGEIVLVASEGGVRSLKAGRSWTGETLVREEGEPTTNGSRV